MSEALADYFAQEAEALRGEVKEKARSNGAAQLTATQTNRVLRILRTATELTDGDPHGTVDVVLQKVGGKKIQVIKAVRSVTDYGLKEAKDAVDSVPTLLAEGVETEEADRMKAAVEKHGATISYE